MPDVQAIIDFYVEINKFINIDLFQRGFYQIRTSLSLPNCKLIHRIELNHQPNGTLSSSNCNNDSMATSTLPACTMNGMAVTKTFQINYKNEEIQLNDSMTYRLSICLDLNQCIEQMRKVNIELNLQLWYSDQESLMINQNDQLVCASTRQLRIHFDLCNGLHYCLPVIFDYFHLSAITLSIHGCLLQLCQPFIMPNGDSSTNGFDETNWLLSSNSKQSSSEQRCSIQWIQCKLISIMTLSILNLKHTLDDYYRLLTPWNQARIDYDDLFVKISTDDLNESSWQCFKQIENHLVNDGEIFNTILCELVNKKKLIQNSDQDVDTDHLIDCIEHDVSHLCARTIEQWQRFIVKMVKPNCERINQHLSKIHHFQRIRRFSESFFYIENSLNNLNRLLCDDTLQLFQSVCDNIRKSSYYFNLPSCDVECVQLDGNYQTIPIIFEERYSLNKQSIKMNNDSSMISSNFIQSPCKLFLPSMTTSLSSSTTTSPRSSSFKLSLFTRFNENDANNHQKLIKKSIDLDSINQRVMQQKLEQFNTFSNELIKDLFKSSLEDKMIVENKMGKQNNNHSWPRFNENRMENSEIGQAKQLDIYTIKYPSGTMYFPKPPKEFAMEEMLDEPANVDDVCMKPIPTDCINDNSDSPKIVINGDRKHAADSQLKSTEKTIKNSLSFKDLTEIKSQDTTSISSSTSSSSSTTLLKKCKNKSSKDDLMLGSNNLNCTKFTFMELLQSDHCLICCGSIINEKHSDSKNGQNKSESWPCKCIRRPIQFVSKSSTPSATSSVSKSVKNESKKNRPSYRRLSLFDQKLLLLDNDKQSFKNIINSKINNLMFYSDTNQFASRIPYFQCNVNDLKSFKQLHLIVCVHGLDGNSADLRLIKTYLEIGLPTNNFEFLMSQRNQGETFDSLETLTERLINEIEMFVTTLKSVPTKISFIGHSLGNIIIRAAISTPNFMKRWRNRFHTFLSLSGPHLGLAYNRSGLVNMGLWFFQKFKRAQSLNELLMKDSTDIRQTFLYRLSTRSGLEYFRNILLCGSSQDYYVPIHSAHIHLCNAAINDQSEYGKAYREMSENILKRLILKPNLNLIRYNIYHSLNNNTNTLIGRAAHIAVLDSELFIEKFMMITGLEYFV